MYQEELIGLVILQDGNWDTQLAVASVSTNNGGRKVILTTDYGFSHRPPAGSNIVTVSPNGMPENKLGVRAFHQDSRVRVLQDGEVAVNSALDDPTAAHIDAPHRITFTEEQEIIVAAGQRVIIRSGDSRVTIQPNGQIVLDGNVVINGALNVRGRIHSESDVTANNISLQRHTHPGDSGGTTGAPN